MLVKTFGSAVFGVEAITITIEVDVNNQGLPGSVIVGLPDSAVKESMQRVESAVKSNGYKMPRTRAVVNMAPADIRKSGTAFDLPIAIGILGATEQIENADILKEFGVEFEMTVVSAHRTPDRMFSYAKEAAARGLKVIIAGAGGAAHLPGMVASITVLPVIGVPVKSSNSIDGWDSILSILQMPNGIPVATVALNAAKNAGLLAVQILSTANQDLAVKMQGYKDDLRKKVEETAEELENS